MKIRLAKEADALTLAKLHIECGRNQLNAFLPELGERFLAVYYRCFMRERHSIILIAEDENSTVLGFSSGTTDAAEHIASMRRFQLSLGLSALPAVLLHPSLIAKIFSRWRSLDHSKENLSYIINQGVRGEYWAWRANTGPVAGAAMLRKAWANVVKSIGYRKYRYEVDPTNSNVAAFEKAFKARVVHEFILPDGRHRVILEEDI